MIPELRFAVAGARGSGKTAFMQRALDLKRPSYSSTCGKKMSLEGQVFLINLIEIQLDQITVSEEEKIHWPSTDVKGDSFSIDGVLALYDVTKRESISRIPKLLSKFTGILPVSLERTGSSTHDQLVSLKKVPILFSYYQRLASLPILSMMLDACSKGSTPCVLIASKCDVPIDSRRIDPQEIEQLCMEETGIESIQISINSPESYKRCVSVVLRNFITNQPGESAVEFRCCSSFYCMHIKNFCALKMLHFDNASLHNPPFSALSNAAMATKQHAFGVEVLTHA